MRGDDDRELTCDQPVGRERGIQHVLYVEFILTVIESARVPTYWE